MVAISLGGYYSPRMASLEPRFAACIAWGAIWDYYATWKKRIDASFKTSLSVPGHHITWILGVDTVEQALEKLEPFRLDGVVQQMPGWASVTGTVRRAGEAAPRAFTLTVEDADPHVPGAPRTATLEVAGAPRVRGVVR